MLSQEEEQALNDRLRNWGRWIAGRQVSRTNMIYRLMLAAGTVEADPVIPSRVDLADAILVNRAWCMLPQQPIRYWAAKNALIAHYAYPTLPIRAFCDWVRKESRLQFGLDHALRLREKDYDALLELAKYEIFNLIERNARKKLAFDPDKIVYDD